MSVLNEIAAAQTAVTERAGGAVVAIGRRGRGSGVVVASNRVLTNAHNLRDRTTAVTFHDGRQTQASVLGADVDGDLVVLEVDTGDVAPIAWAETPASAGAAVFALANPGGRGLRATFGTVSATDQAFRGPRGRRLSGAFEHTAPLARGSSGGPVVDGDGRLLGVNTSRLGDGFYLALAADAALRDRVEALGRGESPQRLRLGVGLAPSHVARRLRAAVGLEPRDGLLVQHVEADTPAAAAGLIRGDLIVDAGGSPVDRADDLLDRLEAHDPAGAFALTVVRGSEERDVAVRFDVAAAETGTA